MKKIILLTIFLMPLFAQDAFLNKPFPKIEGISLSGDKVTFPDVLVGKPSVLAVAFRQKAQKCINTWADELLLKYGIDKSINYYEIPMLGGQYTMARNWIDGGMRGGVPKPLHDYTVTYYGPLRSYFKSLDISSKGDCYMFILNSEGLIVKRHNGYSTEQGLTEMFNLIDSINE
jgi:hypothetical protein